MSDETPDPLAALDQLLRAMLDVAKAVRSYHLALVEQGFSEAQALELAIAYQAQLMRGTAGS